MNMLQIPTTFVDIIEWFNSLNIEFKVLIAIVAVALCMVLIYIAFKLLEVIFLLLKVILDGFLKIFRISSKITKKVLINNEDSAEIEVNESSEQEKIEELEDLKEIHSSEQEKDEVHENNVPFDSDDEEEQAISEAKEFFHEEEANIIKTMDPNNRSNNQKIIPENSTQMINCPNCGNYFCQNSFSKIGDTLFVSCEECGKRYISNGEYLTENEE